MPLFGTRFTKTMLTATTLAPGAALGENQLTYMEDTWLSQSHVGTHLDGMGHIGRKDCYYNQTPMGKFINQNYMTKLGLEHLKSFATRGVVVDMVKVYPAGGQAQEQSRLQEAVPRQGHRDHGRRHPGRAQDVQRHAARGRHRDHPHRVGRSLRAVPGPERDYNSGEPGIGKDAATWLIEQKIVAVGTDTWAVEVIPGENPKEAFIVHQMLITDNGIHIIENVRTDLIAAEAAATGPGDVLLQHDGAQGGRPDRQLRRHRRDPLGPLRLSP